METFFPLKQDWMLVVSGEIQMFSRAALMKSFRIEVKIDMKYVINIYLKYIFHIYVKSS